MKIVIDSADVKIKNGKVTIDINPEQLAALNSCNKVKLSTLKPGDEFKLGDEAFIVLEHAENGTRVITKEFAYSDVEFGNCNNWSISPIRVKLGQEYYPKICEIAGKDSIVPMKRDLTSLDGLDDYDFCIDVVSSLTASEYAKYHKILGLKSNYHDYWWTITPASTLSNGCSRSVCCVGSSGILDWCGCGYCRGVRPFLNLEPSILVSLNKD